MNRIVVLFLACFLAVSMGSPTVVTSGYPTRDVPPAPENVQVEPKDEALRLTWDLPAGLTGNDISGYKLYRGTSSDNVNTIISYPGPFDQSYTDSPLVNGNTYFYSISAVNAEGSGELSEPLSGVPRGPSSRPQNVETGYGPGEIYISWEEPLDPNGSPVTGYVVFKGVKENNISIRNEVGNVLEYEDMGLLNGEAYYYQIAAITDYGDGEKTSIISVVPRTTPSVPTNLTGVANDGSVVISWNASLDNGGAFIEGYSIYRGETIENLVKIATVSQSLTYTDNTAINGIRYFYSVSAFNSEGDGDLISAISLKPVGPPEKPKNMKLRAGDSSVHIKWEEPDFDGGSQILGYRIYKNRHNEDMELDSDIGNVFEYTVTGLENNQIYYFQVRAYNDVGEGKGSNTSMIRPEPVPKTPENFRIIDLKEELKLVWTKPSYTGEYPYERILIYRGENDDSFELHANISADFSQFFDEEVEVGVVYYYEISILSSIGEGYRTPTVVGRPFDRPSVPRSLEINTKSGTALLSWEKPSSSGGRAIENYNIYRGTNIDAMTVLASVGGTRTYYNDTTLTNGVTYYYKISAINTELEGNATDVVAVMSLGPPMDPENTRAYHDPVNNTVEIVWDEPANDGGSEITNYRIYRGEERDNLTFIKMITIEEIYVDDDVDYGTGYYYSISAVNNEGEGPMCPVFFVNVPEEEENTLNEKGGVLIWVILIGAVVLIMAAIVGVALVASKKKKNDEKEKEDIPELEESESEREERLIRERREQMGQFTSISTDTMEAHSRDSHSGSTLTYEDLYGKKEDDEQQAPIEQSIQVDGGQEISRENVADQTFQQTTEGQEPDPAGQQPQYQAPDPLK